MCVYDWVFSINSLHFEDGLLTLKGPITTAAENNFIYLFFFSENKVETFHVDNLPRLILSEK